MVIGRDSPYHLKKENNMTKNKKTGRSKPNYGEKVQALIDALTALMDKNGFNLTHLQYAAAVIISKAIRNTILKLRSQGKSIRAIARFVHTNEKLVSSIIKEDLASYKEECKRECKKACKTPCKKPCKAKAKK